MHQLRRLRPSRRRASFAALAALAASCLASAQTVVTVTNDFDNINGDVSSVAALIADDGGDGISYREAVLAINAGASGPGAPYRIEFAGDMTIGLVTDGPGLVRANTVVDGAPFTVVFDGGGAVAGPSVFGATGIEFHNIEIRNCTLGLLFALSGNHVVRGCVLEDNDVGLDLQFTVSSSLFGGPGASDANVIRNNGIGVRLSNGTAGITLTRNQIFGNAAGIDIAAGGNGGILPPVITALNPVGGSAPANAVVEVFADDGDQGETFVGTVQAGPDGAWSFPLNAYTSPHAGKNLTATATGSAGNTSAFSAPEAVLVPATPAVDDIVLLDATPTNQQVVRFEVEFSEPVDGVPLAPPFDAFDLLAAGSIAGATIDSVTGSGAAYTVHVDIGAGEGTLQLRVNDGAGIESLFGVPLAGPFTGAAAYTIQRLAIDADLPSAIEAAVGDTVLLEVGASAPFPLTYQWFRDTPLKSPSPIGPDAPALTLSNVGLPDAGLYFVEIADVNFNESVTSNTVTLTIVEGVPISGALTLAILASGLAGFGGLALRRRARLTRTAGKS